MVRPESAGVFQRVGADLTAKYVYFICADDYTESIDMPTALHPQTILATKYAGDTLADPFGFPLRLRTSTKLGYKNAKWIKAIEVTTIFARRSGASRALTGSPEFEPRRPLRDRRPHVDAPSPSRLSASR